MDLHAKSAILMDASNQRILYGKNAKSELPMASTTKIMTCLYALEHASLNDIVTFSTKAASAPKVKLGAAAGSQFILSDLLYALMLESSNDAAIAIAEHMSGSVEKFCADMTKEALDFGCYHTSFKTPNGLDSKGHYTTCYDLALIACRALSRKDFRNIIAEPSYTVRELKKNHIYTLNNKDLFLSSYNDAIGIKTGFTAKAGYCFVGAVEDKDHYLVSVVLGCGWPPHRSWKWEDTKRLMDYGIKNYSKRSITIDDKIPDTISVLSGQSDKCKIRTLPPVEILLAEKEEITFDTNIPSVLTAPVHEGDILGTISILINGRLFRKYPITAVNSVRESDYQYIYHLLINHFINGS